MMNFQNTAPTEYDDLNCVHMRINYAEDQTDDVVEHYNWKGDLCDLNADGDLGEHSRIFTSFLSQMLCFISYSPYDMDHMSND